MCLNHIHHCAQVFFFDHGVNVIHNLLQLDLLDVFHAGDFLRKDLGLAVALDILELIDFLAFDEGKGAPCLACPSRPPDTVYIIFIILGEVKIKHSLNIVYVDPSGRHVCG